MDKARETALKILYKIDEENAYSNIVLNNEIKKYGLDEVIEIDTGEYIIVGYGDLETRFIDDRDIKNRVEVKEELDDYEK